MSIDKVIKKLAGECGEKGFVFRKKYDNEFFYCDLENKRLTKHYCLFRGRLISLKWYNPARGLYSESVNKCLVSGEYSEKKT